MGVSGIGGEYGKEELYDGLRVRDQFCKRFGVFRNDIGGIFSVRQVYGLDAHTGVKRRASALCTCGKSRAIGVKRKHEVLRVSLYKRKMCCRKRRARKCDCIRKACLMRMEKIHLPLDKDGETTHTNGVFRLVHPKKNVRLLIEFRFGTVEILRRLIGSERAARKRNR